jgi:hypothetical protein
MSLNRRSPAYSVMLLVDLAKDVFEIAVANYCCPSSEKMPLEVDLLQVRQIIPLLRPIRRAEVVWCCIEVPNVGREMHTFCTMVVNAGREVHASRTMVQNSFP